MNDLTGFQRDLLYTLAGLKQPYGREVKENLDGYYPFGVDTARIYNNLDKLADKGLVHKEEYRRDGRSHTYSISPRGERELVARREWENQYLQEILEDLEEPVGKEHQED